MSYILIDTNGLCFCNCAMRCPLDKSGSAIRCNKEQLEDIGYKTIQVFDSKSENEVHNARCIDGYEHKLKIKNVKIKIKRRRTRGILQTAKLYFILFWRRSFNKSSSKTSKIF